MPLFVEAQPVLQIVKKSTPSPLVRGGDVNYAFTITNIGSLATTDSIFFTDVLPDGVRPFEVTTDAGWVYSYDGTTLFATYAASNPPLAANGGVTHIYLQSALFFDLAVTSITNTATVSGGGTAEPKSGMDFAIIVDAPPRVPLLTITKTHTPEVFVTGEQAAFLLNVNNVGGEVTTGRLTLTDVLPEGLTFVSGVGDGWTFFVNGQTVTAISDQVIYDNPNTTPVVIFVNVGEAAVPSVKNVATIVGGGTTTPVTAKDVVPVVLGLPLPPRNFKAQATKNKFVSQTERIHCLKWHASRSRSVKGYLLFRNGVQIAELSASGPFRYNDRLRHDARSNVYTIVTVGFNEQRSLPMTITLN